MEYVTQINKPKEYIQKIYDVNLRRNIFSIYTTGGGITSLQWLFTTAGASKCIKSGEIPYSRSALKNLIEYEGSELITSYCSLDVAKRIAEKAYRTTVENLLKEEADVLTSPNSNIFGVGCTAALATNIPMRGDHRCYIAIYSPKITVTYSIVMDKEALTRDEEDIICSNFIIHLIGQYCQLPPYLHLEHFEQRLFRYETSVKSEDLPTVIRDTLDHQKRGTIIFPSPLNPEINSWQLVKNSNLPPSSLIFPGSFNPLHMGHLKLIQKAVEKLPSFSGLIIFEIAAVNVDKPPLAIEEIIHRLNQFFLEHQSEEFKTWLKEKNYVIGVAITTTPMFIQKSFLFPNSYFLIGADTLERLLEPRYYRDPTAEAYHENLVTARLIQSISNIHHNGCNFVIGGRIEQRKGVNESDHPLAFQTLSSVVESSQIARTISQLFPSQFFQQIEENEFREDISSSQIRKSQNENR